MARRHQGRSPPGRLPADGARHHHHLCVSFQRYRGDAARHFNGVDAMSGARDGGADSRQVSVGLPSTRHLHRHI